MLHTWILVPLILSSVSHLLAFEMTCKTKPIQMLVGCNASFRCFWKCETKCATKRIIWTKDGHVLQEHPPDENQSNQTVNDKFQFMNQNIENGEVSLDIENLQMSNAGTYKCTVIVDKAFRLWEINLQVSDPNEKHNKDVTEQPDPNQKFNINSKNPAKRYGLGVVGAAAAAFVFVIAVLSFLLWKKRLGCRHCQKKKKLPSTGYGEESNSSSDSDSSKSELIKRTLNHDGAEKNVNLAATQPPFWSQSQAWINGEGCCQEKHLAI
ncbi:uncharacterized protein LOC114661873 [Erpetoichthys calabaricus]|uniref:uncharacterized protein LOC114661873 n=1 Tax=Erpetoichthys calabaricus TaxID=27687 RepID=UPI002233F828|nr:uncharacterized protein LOC114661873 [Erpetoichthys calabaricus]